MKWRASVLLAAFCLSALVPAQELKGVSYKLPDGWQEASEGEAKVFSPKALKEGEMVAVVVTPATAATEGEPSKQFETVVSAANSEVKVLAKGEIESKTEEGRTVCIQAMQCEADGLGKHSRIYAMQFVGKRRLLAIVIMKPDDAATKYGEDVMALIGSLKIKGEDGPPPKAGPGGLAPGFSFQEPANWVQEGPWHIGRHVENRGGGREFTSASIRFMPAVPATGSFDAALRAAWKAGVPDELAERASGMIYRRYVGDQLASHFVFGRGQEKDRQAPTLFTVYLIDCGDMWQPVLISQTYEEPDTRFPTGIEMLASTSYPVSANIAETMLKTFRCPSAKGRALIDDAAVAGNYHFGTGASLMWENIYTGALSMTQVAYGGTLFLKPDKSFTYTFVSAKGAPGANAVRNAKGSGTWSVNGDILTASFSNYDQGFGKETHKEVYRVAGVVNYPDGTKVLVLKSKLDIPINPMTVSDASDYYSTKKSN